MSTEPTPTLGDRIAVWGLLFVLLIPVLWRATVQQRAWPGTPRLLDDVQNIARLFTHRPEAWNSYYIQVRNRGEVRFETLDVSDFFGLRPFGHRDRLHRFWARTRWQRNPVPAARDMAAWLWTRWPEVRPNDAPPEAIRFTRSWTRPQGEQRFDGAWTAPQWEDRRGRRKVLATVFRQDVEVPRP